MRKITPSIMVQLILIFLVAGQLVTQAQEEDYRTYVPVGAVEMYLGSPPDSSTGWLVADGSCISRSAYDQLFAVIGTLWGDCDGSTTFALPDMRGRSPIGAGLGDGLTINQTLGQWLGQEQHTLSISEMPAHTHQVRNRNQVGANFHTGTGGANPSIADAVGTTNSGTANTTTSTGNGSPFFIYQPSLVVNYLIWAGIEALEAPGDVVITVVVVFPTHTPTPTLTPSITPTDGPSPTPTPTASNTPSGNIPLTEYEVGGQTVVVQNLVTPGDAAIVGLLVVLVGLFIGAMILKQRRRL